MRPETRNPATLRRRLLPQVRLDGCRRWRRTLREACWDYAVLHFLAKHNCEETHDEQQYAADAFRMVPHLCNEECWGKTTEYKQAVCERYARLLERKLRREGEVNRGSQ